MTDEIDARIDSFSKSIDSNSEYSSHCMGLVQNPVAYSGFWIRLGAYVIDQFILLVLGLGIGVLWISLFESSFISSSDEVFNGICFLVAVLYFASMESSAKQATIGKQILHLKVLDSKGERITFLRAIFRYIMKIVSIFSVIGILLVGFNNKKRGLHDMIADTFVIHAGSL